MKLSTAVLVLFYNINKGSYFMQQIFVSNYIGSLF